MTNPIDPLKQSTPNRRNIPDYFPGSRANPPASVNNFSVTNNYGKDGEVAESIFEETSNVSDDEVVIEPPDVVTGPGLTKLPEGFSITLSPITGTDGSGNQIAGRVVILPDGSQKVDVDVLLPSVDGIIDYKVTVAKA